MSLNHLSSQPVPIAERVAHTGWPAPSGMTNAANALGSGGAAVHGVTPPSPAVDIHPALQAVRQMPEFQPPQPNWLDQLWRQPMVKKLSHELGRLLHQAWASLWNWLSKLKPVGLMNLPSHLQDGFSGLVGVVLILLGLFVLYLVLGWLLRLRENAAAKTPPAARMLENVLLVSSEHHYQQAQLAAGAGNFEQALRQLYMATLCLLDEQKLAPYEATRTNLEYLALLEQGLKESVSTGYEQPAKRPLPQQTRAMQDAFGRMARQFESVRFGLRPMSATQFEESRADYQAMAAMAESRTHG